MPWTKGGTGPRLNMSGTYPAARGPNRRRSAEEHLGRLEQLRVQQLRLGERLRQRDADDLRAAQRDHLAVVALVHGVDRLDAEAGAEHAIVGERSAAALDMAQDRHPRLEAGALLDLALQLDRDPAEARVAERVGLVGGDGDAAAVAGHRALGDDDDREGPPAGVAALDPVAD